MSTSAQTAFRAAKNTALAARRYEQHLMFMDDDGDLRMISRTAPTPAAIAEHSARHPTWKCLNALPFAAYLELYLAKCGGAS